MVRITFDVDDDVMQADADNEVSEARRGLLVETYFEFPVHFASAIRTSCAHPGSATRMCSCLQYGAAPCVEC